MARSFTNQEKENIRQCLLEKCKQDWTQYGYKKTSVEDLCMQAGISKGAFYLFFESKEALFCEVLCSVQEQICQKAALAIEKYRNRHGITEALKLIYREYDKNNFLYNSDNRDYTILKNKLSKEQTEKIEKSNQLCRQIFFNRPYLKYKVNEDMAMSVIYSLIMSIRNKTVLPYNHLETFDFMAEQLVDSLIE